jgi:hypothetical protein
MLKPLLISLTLSQTPEIDIKDRFELPEEKKMVVKTMSYSSQEQLIKEQNEKIIELILKQMIEENK